MLIGLLLVTAASARPACFADTRPLLTPPPPLTPPPLLTLDAAVRAALQGGNLDIALAAESVEEARARADLALAALYPRADLLVGVENKSTNLRAMGITFPGAPAVVGPFDTYWATARLTQKALDLADWDRVRLGRRGMEVQQQRLQLSREAAAHGVAAEYLDALRRKAEVDSILADLALDDDLLTLARQEKETGFATGIDVKRAETRTALDRSRLLDAERRQRDAVRVLLTACGLPLDPLPELGGDLAAGLLPAPEGDADPVTLALASRTEMTIAGLAVDVAGLEGSAVRAERYPSIVFTSEATESGLALDELDFTRRFRLEADLRDLTGSARRARQGAARSRLSAARISVLSLKRGIELEARSADDELQTAGARLGAETQALELAEATIDLARQRFAAGLATNLEVVSAQADLAEAKRRRIEAAWSLERARLNLHRATGQLRRLFDFL